MTSAALAVRVRAAVRGRRADVALAVLLAIFAVPDVLLHPDPGWLGPDAVPAVVMPALALSLAWRRRRPLTVLAIVVGGTSAVALAFGATESWSNVFIPVVAVYSAVLYGSAPLLAAAVAMAGIVIFSLRDPLIDSFGEAVWGPSLAVLSVGAGLTARGIRSRATAVEQRAEALDREEERLAAEAAAEERRRIARELHDIVSHSLGVVVLQAGAAERVLDRDPARARQVLESIRATGQEAVGEMGTLLGLLDGGGDALREPQPSLADLDGLVLWMRDSGLRVDLSIEGQPRELPAALELSAFRVIQEGLTNALKHGGAHAHVRAVLRYGSEELLIEVTDDGSGAGDGPGSRRGLAGVRERVEVFGGRFEAGPRAGGGWTFAAAFPLVR